MHQEMLEEETFAPILAAARVGADWALAELWRLCNPRLVAWLHAEVGAAAEDVASETWMAVARGLVRFEGDADGFRAWLYTIARRRVVDHRRRQGRQVPTAPLDGHDHRSGDDTSAAVLDRMALDDAAASIALLAPEQAEVIRLRVLAGLSVAEVAAVLGKQPGAVRVQCHRGLRRLAEVLSADRAREGV